MAGQAGALGFPNSPRRAIFPPEPLYGAPERQTGRRQYGVRDRGAGREKN